MRKPVLLATLKSKNIIEVTISKDFYTSPKKVFSLFEDDKFIVDINPVSQSESQSTFIYTLLINDFTFHPGLKYEIKTSENYFIPIDLSFLASLDDFEKRYRYDGRLGATYSKERTIFSVFSPFSESILLKIKRKGSDKQEIYEMIPDRETGVFSLTLEGDLDEAAYLFTPTIFGETKDVVDPYAFALGSNSRIGYVIDPERVRGIYSARDLLPEFDDPLRASIYECSVRDMTSKTDVTDKCTFEALARDGSKNRDGDPVGMDYIASLGVTHVQLGPVLDFHTIDDEHPLDSYNWGYDPYFFFAPEGSYSSDPSDPYARNVELRQLVSSFHSHGMRVILDVVYNHVFCVEFNSLNLLVPRYYFRTDSRGNSSNGSGCGNDLESRRYMARKLIIDSLIHLLDFFDVDGFRFDLISILDVDTVNLIAKTIRERRPDALIYGEGWNLATALPSDQKSDMDNAYKLPDIAFFNDRFRDVTKGSTSSLPIKGYLSGDTNYIDGFKHVYLGSAIALAFAPLFSSPEQSVNYVECHDNHTLYDKLMICCKDESQEEILKRIKLINAAISFSSGISFFHQGQEVGLSKGGKGNSYNAGDSVNGIDYETIYKRKDMLMFFRDLIAFKNKFFGKISDLSEVSDHITFDNLSYNAIKINYSYPDFEAYFIFNPTKNSFTYNFEDYVNLVFNDTGNVANSDFYIRMAIISGLSLNVFVKNKGNRK